VDEFLAKLAKRLQTPGADTVSADEIEDWPQGKLKELVTAGILTEIPHAKGVICDQCGESHYIEPDIRKYPDGKAVGVYICPDVGRIEIDLNRLKQWQINRDKLEALGLLKKNIKRRRRKIKPDKKPKLENTAPLQLAEKLRIIYKFSYRIIATLPFSAILLDGKKATPAPLTSDDISANHRLLTTWEDIFDSYSSAFEQFLFSVEEAILLTSKVLYEKKRELLISLIRIKNGATEILKHIKHDRGYKMVIAGDKEEISAATRTITDLFNCDLPDCSAVEFFSELKGLSVFADEVEIEGRLERSQQSPYKQQSNKLVDRDKAKIIKEIPELNDAERFIIEALGKKTLTGEKLAEGAGYPYNSNFKSTLAHLRKRGILDNKAPGYIIKPEYHYLLKKSNYNSQDKRQD
jgi:hypothetical protein